MKKLTKYIVTAGFILIVFMSLIFAQSEKIILDNHAIFKGKERTPVNFSHADHMSWVDNCKKCHHIYKLEKNVINENLLYSGSGKIGCANCHKKKAARSARYNLMDAYHLQCIGCHRGLMRNGNKSGPIFCAGCHPAGK